MRLKFVLIAVMSVWAGLGITTANAVPILLNQAEFSAATSGLTTVIEDFESFSVGLLTSPVTLANSTYTSIVPQIRQNESNNPTNALFENDIDPVTGRIFSLFLLGTRLFGTDVRTIDFNSNEVLDITVSGGSGMLNLQASFATLNEFFGVSDPLGLNSVSFRNLGDGTVTSAWGLDNVTTAALQVQAIPEPTTVALLSLGLAGLGLSRRRKVPKP